MSWSTHARVATKAQAREHIERDTELAPNYHAPQESLEQLQAAKVAAISLIESGAVGEGPFSVNLSGHANPAHGDVQGYATDLIYVQVMRIAAS